MQGPAVTIVVPAFNEVTIIDKVLDDLIVGYPEYEILVVDDGSVDGTFERVRGKACRVVRHARNRGYGATWKTGIALAKGDVVVFYDGDGQFEPDDVGRLVAEMEGSSADLVIGRRGRDSHQPLSRRPGKAVLTSVANFLVKEKIPDLNCGLRAVRRSVIRRYAHLLPNGFSASTTSTIVFLKRGYSIAYVPVRVKKRTGTSTVKPVSDGSGVILYMIRLIALFDPLRIFLSLAFVLFVAASAYSVYEIIVRGQGVPVLGAIFLVSSVLFFALGIICDQISMVRLERYEADRQDHAAAVRQGDAPGDG